MLVALVACNGGLRAGVYRGDDVAYRVGEPPASWRQVGLRDNDVAFVDPAGLFLIGVNATCEEHGDPPLEVLTRHLLIGFTDRVEVSREERRLDGRAALRSHYRAELDGVPVEMVLWVMKKDLCVYDFTYLAPVGRLAEHQAAFDQLLQTFTTEVSK